jgi:hypothetical protein
VILPDPNGVYGGHAELSVEVLLIANSSVNWPRVVYKNNSFSLATNSPTTNIRWSALTSSSPTGPSVANITAGAVHHVIGVWDGTNQDICLDGAFVSGQTQTGSGAINSNTNTVYLGSEGSGGDNWDGTLFFVRVYTRALNAGEVAWLYSEAMQRGQPQRDIAHIPLVEDETALKDSLIGIPGGMTPLEPYK